MEKLGYQSDEKNSGKLQGEPLQIFTEHKAVYHKRCVSKYNAQKLQRVMKRNQKLLDNSPTESSSSSIETVAKKCVRRSDSIEKLILGESKYLFCRLLDKSLNLCAAGTLHAQLDKVHTYHVSQFIETLRTKALKLNATQVLTAISTGDVTDNEIYYHKKCLMQVNNKYSAAIKQETAAPDNPTENFLEEMHFRKIIHFVKEQYMVNFPLL